MGDKFFRINWRSFVLFKRNKYSVFLMCLKHVLIIKFSLRRKNNFKLQLFKMIN